VTAQQRDQHVSEEFEHVLRHLRATTVRPEVLLDETPGPTRLAPYAAAFTGEVSAPSVPGAGPGHDPAELASGRLVLLHDPDGVDVWEGRYRFVALVQAQLDGEMLADPLLAGVGWSWVTETLARHEADHLALAGTVTRTWSESFGTVESRPATGDIEIRASWTPDGVDLPRHLRAWAELLCVTAGLPPLTEGVVAISQRRRR
jgi:hypothetical protein